MLPKVVYVMFVYVSVSVRLCCKLQGRHSRPSGALRDQAQVAWASARQALPPRAHHSSLNQRFSHRTEEIHGV